MCASEKCIIFVRLLKTIFHLAYYSLTVYITVFGMIMINGLTEEQVKNPYIANVKYFSAFYGTNWNYLFQSVFLFLALIHDCLEWVDKQSTQFATKIRYWRDVIFCGLVVPYTCFVFGMFWSLYAIDRELVFPRVYDEVVPWWFNQCVHTNIVVMVIAETILQARRHPTNKKLELIMNGSVGILYAIVYYSIYFIAHRWLYNVFGILTWWQVCLFQCGIWLSSYIFYVIQFPINRLIHGNEPEEKKEETIEKQWSGRSRNGLECSGL